MFRKGTSGEVSYDGAADYDTFFLGSWQDSMKSRCCSVKPLHQMGSRPTFDIKQKSEAEASLFHLVRMTGLDEIKVLLGQALASNGPPDRCIRWVRVLPPTCKKSRPQKGSGFLACRGEDSNPSNATVRWTVAGRRLDGGHTLIPSSPVIRTPEKCVITCRSA